MRAFFGLSEDLARDSELQPKASWMKGTLGEYCPNWEHEGTPTHFEACEHEGILQFQVELVPEARARGFSLGIIFALSLPGEVSRST